MRWRMPTSVATMNVEAGEAAARRTMPSVEVTTVAGPATSPEDIRYRVDDVQPHSGWIEQLRIGVVAAHRVEPLRDDARMHVALPHPDVHACDR